jgi:eukaryotic-like serine/threonine-protein kinase
VVLFARLQMSVVFPRDYNDAQRMGLISGTKLGPYEIISPLGSGGMGEVYRARDTRLDRTVAIKILPAHLSSNPEAKQRFEREARAISSLNHPNICTLYDVGHQDGTDYLVMEFLEGETLASRLAKGPLPAEQVLKCGVEICEGLEKAHKTGVIHRDLKPGNIMLTKAGAKLMDFGLAKAVTGPPPSTGLTATLDGTWTGGAGEGARASQIPLTARGTIVGTFQYMSPEQVEGKEADARSDIFALGAVLYEMATGKRAFEGKTTASVIAAVLERNPAPISVTQPMSPPVLDRLVKTCLAKDPDERFQTVHDVKLQLEWIAEGGSQAGMPLLRRHSHREWIAWAIAVLALTLLAASLGYFWRTGQPQPVVTASILPPEGSQFISLEIEGGAPAISPDGKKLVFVARDKSGDPMLWLRPVDSVNARQLSGTNGGGHPFWSPDSRFIGFFTPLKLAKVDTGSGSVQTICESTLGRGGSWNRDDVILFTPNTADVLYRVSATGGKAVPATQFDASRGENSHRWPQFLPDGKHFLFLVRSSQGPDFTGTYLGALDSKEHHLILHADFRAVFVQPGYLLSVREQLLVAQPFDLRSFSVTGDAVPIAEHIALNGGTSAAMFSASDNGVLAYETSLSQISGWDLVWYDRSGKRLETVGTNFFQTPSLSPDGTKLAVGLTDLRFGTSDLWLFDLTRGTKTRLTFDPSRENNPVWMPDGQSIIFSSNKTGTAHIYRMPIQGTGATETLLATEGAYEYPQSVCRDGRYLLYRRRASQNTRKYDIWVLPLFGDGKPFPLVQSDFDDLRPTFSPDCKWVAYASNETGQSEVYITHFPDGAGKRQVSTDGGVSPRWRGDGKELFFIAPQARELWSISVAPQGAGLQLGTPHVLFPAQGVSFQFGSLEVRADGQRFLVNGNNMDTGSAPITLLVNWEAELHK